MARSYFATRIGPHTGETPEGYFLFTDAVIARTGFQKYKGSELPQRDADTDKDEITMQDLGIGPDDLIDIYRPAEEVFHPATIASFENKVITDEHPEELLNSENTKHHDCGHLFNVRKGKVPLETGDWPLLADGMITDKALIDKIRSGIKDLSCGYNYRVDRAGNKVLQVGIVGNHLAVVPNGRAGLAFIKDSAVEDVQVNQDQNVVKNVSPHLEPLSMNALMKKIMGLGVKAYAADANLQPEELSELLEAQASTVKPVGKDAEEEKKDAKAEDAHPEGCRCKDCMPGKDAKAKDTKPVAVAKDETKPGREKYHAALERHLDEMDKTKEGEDNDLNELRMLMAPGNTVSKETPGLDADEDEEMMDAEEMEGKDEEGDYKENEEARETEETAAADEDLDVASPIIEPVDRQKPDVPRAVDSKAILKAKQEGAAAALKAFRPFVARSNDKKLRAGFDSIVKEYNKGSLVKGSGYSKVAKAASTQDAAAIDSAKTDIKTKPGAVKFQTPSQLADTANSAYVKARADMSKTDAKGVVEVRPN